MDPDRPETGPAREEASALPVTRRTALKLAGAGAFVTATAGCSESGPPPLEDDGWTVVALPDTQFYAENATGDELEYAREQTEWIADNVDAQKVAFVSHEGDLVQHGERDLEWANIDEVMATLDGVVPYAVLPGNHDFFEAGDRLSGIQGYKDTFPPSRFDASWFGGAGPAPSDAYEGPPGLNSYQRFSAGGYDFLHLALEWEPPGAVDEPDTPLGWAQGVLDDHPDTPTILTHHAHLKDLPEADGGERRATEVAEANGIGTAAVDVWDQLIAPNPQVFMVLGGHYFEMAFSDEKHHAGEGAQVGTNVSGLPVYEMLANYQWLDTGGDGWMRLIRFRPGGGDDGDDRIEVRTFTPSIPRSQWGDRWTDGSSRFHFDLDFADRFDPSNWTRPSKLVLQDGRDGYAGTADTIIDGGNPRTAYGDDRTLTVDSGLLTHALVRFDGVVGGNGVPPGASVLSATLTLTGVDDSTSNQGHGVSAHRLLRPWDESATWAGSFGGDGVDADGTDAVASAEDTPNTETVGPTKFDVVESVRAWVDGAENHGWAILPNGTDGWDFATADQDAQPPPKLFVTYMTDG